MGTNPTIVHPRFALAATVMLREASGAAVLARLKNISLSGCYLETPREIQEGARVRLILQTANVHADVCGIVRRRDGNGLGLAFTNGATVEDWKRLETFIKELQDSAPSGEAAAAGSSR